MAEGVVERADQGVQHGGLDQLRPRDRENVADEHLLQVLGFLCGLRHHEDRDRSRDRVDDADDRLLRDPRLPVHTREGKNRRSQKRETERIEVSRRRMEIVSHQVGDGGPERGDLSQRQVHEDDAALDDVNAEIGVDSRQNETGDERRKQQLQQGHG